MAENRRAVPETVQEAERRGTDMWKRNMLWTVLILVAFIVYTAVRGSSTFAVALTEAEVQITYPNKSVTSLPYGEITAVSLLKDADFGECVSGTQQGSGWYGQWHSSEWGRLHAVHPSRAGHGAEAGCGRRGIRALRPHR